MRLGLALPHTGIQRFHALALARRAEANGFDSVWTGEGWGTDAVSLLAWLAAGTERVRLGTAILQIPARRPAMAAMTAATLDHLSDGRFVLGLGASGPAVAEGWHGQPFADPIGRTREYVEVVRAVLLGDAPVVHRGAHYRLPFDGAGSTGNGKPLRSAVPTPADLPILLAAQGPRNVAAAVEIANGVLPSMWSPSAWRDAFGALVDVRAGFEIDPTVTVVVGDDVGACRDSLRPGLAFYLGGMGTRERSFYADVVSRFGFADDVARVRACWAAGDRSAAVAAISDRLVDEIALVGPPARIRDRLAAWRETPVTTMIVATTDLSTLDVVAEAVA